MISFFERGGGEKPVLMLHGYLGTGRNLASLTQRLSEARPDLRFYVCDLPGHGASEPLDEAKSFRSLVEPVRRFSEDLRQRLGRPLAAVGHSMGGRVALSIAALEPEVIEAVTMIDIAPGPIGDRNTNLEHVARAYASAPVEASSRDDMRAHLMAAGLTRPLADWLLMTLRPEGERLVWRVDRAALIALGAATRSDDLWQEAQAVGQKLTCIYGETSSFIDDDDRARLRALGARVIGIANAGHFVHVDALEALTTTLSHIL